MNPTQLLHIRELVEQSMLLSEQKKQEILRLLNPFVSEVYMERIEQIMASEPELLKNALKQMDPEEIARVQQLLVAEQQKAASTYRKQVQHKEAQEKEATLKEMESLLQ